MSFDSISFPSSTPFESTLDLDHHCPLSKLPASRRKLATSFFPCKLLEPHLSSTHFPQLSFYISSIVPCCHSCTGRFSILFFCYSLLSWILFLLLRNCALRLRGQLLQLLSFTFAFPPGRHKDDTFLFPHLCMPIPPPWIRSVYSIKAPSPFRTVAPKAVES